ncbi:C40 family peptidase [Nesterenkonia sphaerica]|uniref:NlpC/P60 family protein n=1 Tax=Nesterenkonia sphaerica TaxID=1804988 RepID=A0A5R9A7T0_9MICC|nr:C40 family peptidase [Nesterenkonia sphaerica]TLP74065.1 NlpC/P60 family protein [Nesterenkonia sphaerica]
MTDNNTFVSRRERRARKSSSAGHAGRATAAVLTSAGLVIATGVAASADTTASEGRAASTVQIDAALLTVERATAEQASVESDATVAASADVAFSSGENRPVITSQASPEPVAPAADPAPEVEPAPAQPAAQDAGAEAATNTSTAANQSGGTTSAEGGSSSQASASNGGGSASESSSTTASSSTEQSAPSSGGRGSVISAAYSTLGTPHVMGGTTPGSGIDCSGMIQYAYAQAGISVPRTTHGMASLPRVSTPAPGDIVLANGNSHGGIYVGNGQVISTTASAGVRVHGINDGWHNVTSIHRPR